MHFCHNKVLPFFDAYFHVRNAKRPLARNSKRPKAARDTAELSISTSKELSRTLACKGQNAMSVAANARIHPVIYQCRHCGSDTKRLRISTFTRRCRPHIYMRQVNVRG